MAQALPPRAAHRRSLSVGPLSTHRETACVGVYAVVRDHGETLRVEYFNAEGERESAIKRAASATGGDVSPQLCVSCTLTDVVVPAEGGHCGQRGSRTCAFSL